MTPVLSAKNLTFGYQRNSALACEDISFDVFPGEIVALLGPNGAGKSSLLSLISGLRFPTHGHVQILGRAPSVLAARRELGMTPQESEFPKSVRVGEVLKFVAAQYGADIDARVVPALQLEKLMGRRVGTLSGGERRRLGLACALVAKPRLLVLDEPTSGLDLECRQTLFAHLRHLVHAEQAALLFSTHHLSEVESLGDRVMVINRGRLIRKGSLAEIRSEFGFKRVRFECVEDVQPPSMWRLERQEGRYELLASDPERFLQWLVKDGCEFKGLEVQPASLEEIFYKMVAKT